nr:uncharacterized mitochondrial protein AtMg00810-like [Tanacetum cinerariifolium]
TECIVLSLEFKLPDENQVLLRVPRENNMYNVDLKNIVPSGDLTCLFAKATLDESNLWHRRLGHINFKTINKLVKDPLDKIDEKADEGFLVGYSVSSKAFRVFNSRTRIVQETLHINFLENKPNVIGNQANPSVGVLEQFDEEKAGEENVQQYVFFPLWASGSINPYNTDNDAFGGKKPEFKGEKPESEVHVSPSSKFEDISDNSINEDNAADSLVSDVGQISTNSTSTISAAGHSNTVDPDYPDKVSKVVKALYGLHQAPRAWQKGDILLVQIYVDDIIFGSTNKDLCKAFEKLMKDKFQMSSMGELTFFLGLQVKQKHDGIFISQDKCVAEILRKFSLTDGKSVSTPIDTEKPLLKDPDGKDVDVHTYRSMIGSLMYLTSSRPDIMFAVYACDHFQVTPKALHLHAVKRIFRYLKGKPHLGLWYPKDSPFDLVSYSNSDYAGVSLDRKSTTGGCQFFRCRLISWKCKKQIVVATSSTKAEYVAVCKLLYTCAMDSESIAGLWVNDVMRLQALVDRKKVIITEATIRDALRLDDAESIDFLPNEEIFTELSRMGKVDALEQDKVAQALKIIKLKQRVKKLERKNKREIITNLDADEDVILKDVAAVEKAVEIQENANVQGRQAESQAQIYKIDLEHADKVLSIQDDDLEPAELKEVVEVRKEKEEALKRKPQTEAQARKNLMIYLRNMVGFKMDYFKGMSYDDIHPIFEKYFNSNVAFLEKSKEQLEEEASRALKRASKSQAEKAVKKQKLDEEIEELKKHIQIVPNDEDDVYTEDTPLARKVPVVDYEIYIKNNKLYFKIIRADGSHQLFLSFLSLLRNFDREDLEVLWQIVKERFTSSKPKNFSDDLLLTTLTYMFEKLDIQAQIWKNQRSVHGLEKVKSYRLLKSCGVHIITFTTTQMILLVERRYPLTMFTLDQKLNNVRLEVEEESEVSLELLRFVRQQQQEGFRPE